MTYEYNTRSLVKIDWLSSRPSHPALLLSDVPPHVPRPISYENFTLFLYRLGEVFPFNSREHSAVLSWVNKIVDAVPQHYWDALVLANAHGETGQQGLMVKLQKAVDNYKAAPVRYPLPGGAHVQDFLANYPLKDDSSSEGESSMHALAHLSSPDPFHPGARSASTAYQNYGRQAFR
ncbi:hypothetical protein JCM11641_002174 [Rhodosporidiobolus odoratus]